MIKIFSMNSRTYDENFVSIRQAVVDKNTKVVCGQTKRQMTDRQIDSQTNEKSLRATLGEAEQHSV